jgi:hypothetical protein|tara:strand:- start:471 stop:902 length:432 start_codon:yes stop_codon:yes gene_type:complete
MPKSRVKRSKMFRDFSFIDKKSIGSNHIKHYKRIMKEAVNTYGLSARQILFLIHAYDLEFWTIDYISKSLDERKNQIGIKVLYPLLRKEYVYKHFDKLTPSDTLEDHIFRDETKYNYRIRYAISQKARLLVARFYNRLEGKIK